MANRRILVISDLHCPYHHPDTVKYLKAIKKKYKPDRIISIGDELDKHAMSFHESDPDLYSAGEELRRGREVLWEIYDIFPKVTVIESNHGSLAYRKAKHAGIPKEYLKTYEDVLEVPGWDWQYKLELKLPDGQPVMFHHGKSANYLLASKNAGMSYVQGHFHSKFGIQYWGCSERLNWAMNVGCLINDEALAFEYNKTTMDRPIIGCGMIIDSHPHLIPLIMKRGGKWCGRLT